MDFFLKGGPLMWPILIESVLALWVIIERAIFALAVLPRRRKALSDLASGVANPGSTTSADVAGELGDFAAAIDRARQEGALNQSLLVLQADRLVGEAEKNISILNIVAQSAPLLGLLGTVMGMIRAFIRIQALGGQVNPSDLAGGIWEALITTAAGLTVAIPALIAYMGYSRMADRYARHVESAVSQIVHKLSRSGLEVG
jgi:biopolymer transport protein ExbB